MSSLLARAFALLSCSLIVAGSSAGSRGHIGYGSGGDVGGSNSNGNGGGTADGDGGGGGGPVVIVVVGYLMLPLLLIAFDVAL